MSEVLPFRGIRYNPEIVGDLWSVLSPPWDKLTPDKAEKLRNSHPNNIAHLLIPNPHVKEPAWPLSTHLFFEKWIEDGALKQDSQIGFYAHRETFEYAGKKLQRLGFLGLARLGAPEVSAVYPHEKIFPTQYQTRLQLIRATDANFGPIFMIYPDPQRETSSLLGDTPENAVRVMDTDYGVYHEMWQVTDPDACKRLMDWMGQRDLFIADGHHRYGAAQEYAREWHEANPKAPAKLPIDFRMSYMVPMEMDGLLILPTHRVFKELAPKFEALGEEKLRKFFDIVSDSFESEKALLEAMAERSRLAPDRRVLGIYDGKRFMLLQWTGAEPASYSEDHAEKTAIWKSLDVNVLHEILLPEVLVWDKGTDPEWASHFREAELAAEAVRSKPGSLAVFLNPTSRYEVQEIALAGEKMPQKSTDFYPKIPSGFVFRRIESDFGV